MKILNIIFIILLYVSCKKEDTTTVSNVVSDVKANTEIVAKEGTGKITLKCNGKELITEGVCGVLVSMGELTIAVKDKINPAKVFTVTFNGEDFPENGTIYKVKTKDYLSEDKGPKDEILLSFLEVLPNNKMNTWGSENAKGIVQFTQNGNEIKCVLKDIQLSSNDMFNTKDLQGIGNVSGELTFYKN